MSNLIKLHHPDMGKRELQAVKDVFKSGWLGMGQKTQEFEEKFANLINCKYAVAVNSCTAALSLAIKLLNIGVGDEVIVPTLTFIATAHAVVCNGATPIFCDINKDTLLIDFEDVKRKITQRTKAIIVVHLYGRCVDILELKKQIGNDIYIIEDCAHACGSSLNGIMAGNLGDIGCFSFHAAKNITTGDGGMLTLSNHNLAKRAKSLSWLGIRKNMFVNTENRSELWNYQIDEIGFKYHMNDINAAIGIIQLEKLLLNNDKRRKIAELYFDLLKDLDVTLPQKDTEISKSSWHIFHIKINSEKRDGLSKYLYENNIDSRVHYKPIHLNDIYGNIVNLPVAQKVWEELLSIPIHPNLTKNDVNRVVKYIGRFFKQK